jgi:hypothetical protein
METQFPPLGQNIQPWAHELLRQALMETGPEFNANYTLVGVKPFLKSLKSWLFYYAHY